MRRMLSCCVALLTCPLAAQSPATALNRAAAAITPAGVTRRIGIIADDSMMGRDTPSRGLELTARYVADQFRRAGLRPGGDSGTYFQRYPVIRQRIIASQSYVAFEGPGGTITLPFTTAAFVADGPAPKVAISGPIVLLSAVVDLAKVPAASVHGQIVLWLLDMRKPLPAIARQAVTAWTQAGARAVILVSNADSAVFATQLARRLQVRTAREGATGPVAPVVLQVSERALLAQMPEAAPTLSQLRGSPAAAVASMSDWTGTISVTDSVVDRALAPNTIGVLPGSDPKLRDQYVFVTAHMDHIGITSGAVDSINNGADDDGSGTVGVMELADAFARGPRPRRTMVFMTVSGEEKGCGAVSTT